jgi:hypothetical protein
VANQNHISSLISNVSLLEQCLVSSDQQHSAVFQEPHKSLLLKVKQQRVLLQAVEGFKLESIHIYFD